MGLLYKLTVATVLAPILTPAFLATAILAWPCNGSPFVYAYNFTFRSIGYLWNLWDAEVALRSLDHLDDPD